jgi:hypothetical protein
MECRRSINLKTLDRIPMRPVVAFNNAPTHKFAKFTAHRLRQCMINTPMNTKNGAELEETLLKVKLHEGEKLVSFDVVNLYTSIPIDPGVEATKRLLHQTDQENIPKNLSIASQ